MKKSKLDAPHIKTEVVKRLAVGESQSSISKAVGLHRSQVSRFANREDIQAFIEQEQKRLLEVVPDAVENVKRLVREMKKIPKKENKRRELSFKASSDVLKSVGILPSPVQSQTLVNIYQKNINQFIPPVIQKLLEERNKELNRLASQNINIQEDEE